MTITSNAVCLEGQIERITFRNEENHFLIAKFRVPETAGLVTVLGYIPEPRAGETLRLTGQWSTHPRFGQQFKVERCEVLLPSELEQIRRYLGSGLIKGIGPKITDRLVARFKEQTLTVIESAPERLTEVAGIGPEKAARMGQAWREHHALRALMAFLQAHDIKPLYGAKLYKAFGGEALEILHNDPYRVAREIPRAGFYIADAVVRKSGRPVDETKRAQACLRHLLEESGEQGHVYLPKAEIETRCAEAFELDYRAVSTALECLTADGQIHIDPAAPDGPVYLAPLYLAENEIARRLKILLTIAARPAAADTDLIAATVVHRMDADDHFAERAAAAGGYHYGRAGDRQDHPDPGDHGPL